MKKIAKNILPYTSAANSKNVAQEMKELRDMLHDTGLSEEERKDIDLAMERVQRSDRIDSFFVVGVTCASTSSDILHDLSCGLLILDEASQMTEPNSLLPITRFSCKRLLMVGDPLQLPVRYYCPDCFVAYCHIQEEYRARS